MECAGFMLRAQTQQTQNICIAFEQRRPNVFDVGPTLYKCYTNDLCSLERYTVHVMNPKTKQLYNICPMLAQRRKR